MKHFSNEVAVIVGGSSGIGKETALRFADRGAQIILIARGIERLQEVVAEIRKRGGKAEAFSADVSNMEDVKKAVRRIEETYGRVDVLVYSAAIFYLSSVEALDIRLAKQSMEINYWGAVHVTREILPLIRKGKRKSIVYVTSLSAQCTPPFFTAYAASKHALRGFILSLRQELRPEGIHVGMVSPGPVNTPLIENDIHKNMYRLPPGVPVLKTQPVAEGILSTVVKRRKELVLPRRMTAAARLASAFPSCVEWYYRLSVPGWDKLIRAQIKRPTV
ncbi:oxidoreductase [Collibacillus ludicampi]|uniref:Oxidoreductase n=1 Tax=Collibacillus ludicampi TaxID=2771369 RepID=A0AAV4LFB8_9BACL|nr:SDR family NAD(P)-dependent oxidoreductase [Collibacillus ludicampi]GIM46398.1 oxidoreductase [Collibacillus ludicampi]